MSIRRAVVTLAVLAICVGSLAPAGSTALGAVGAVDGSGLSAPRVPTEAVVGPGPASGAAPALPAVPAGWPSNHLELGLADEPGGAAALRASAPFEFRYQYLAGGVNTGNGWATWNANGQFVSYYIADSVANHVTPVFPYYMLLHSNPATGSSESARDLSNLANHTTMAAYYDDLRLFFARAAGSTPVVLHVEPDLWGYIEQAIGTADDARLVPASVASSGDAALADLPNTAAGFARAIVRLRDQLAPNVILAYHLSVWGTNRDISYSNDPDPQVDALAARAAAFYHSLGAAFDVTFTDIGDRDADFKKIQPPGDGGAAWWDAADFARYARFIAGFVAGSGTRVVVWQIPLGNTKMRAQDDTWGHYQDNRVEWFLDDPGDGHLAVWRDAGVLALLYGGGAGGTTCACDGQGDGVTNPAPINGNTGTSLSADDDGGYFHDRAAAYYAGGALSIDPGSGGGGGGGGGSVASWTLSASPSPTSLTRGHSVTVTAKVKASVATRARIRVDVYDPAGHLAFRKTYAARTFKAGATVTVKPTFLVSVKRRTGTYVIKVRTLAPTVSQILATKTSSRTFRVR
jgi:hypothetical protein